MCHIIFYDTFVFLGGVLHFTTDISLTAGYRLLERDTYFIMIRNAPMKKRIGSGRDEDDEGQQADRFLNENDIMEAQHVLQQHRHHSDARSSARWILDETEYAEDSSSEDTEGEIEVSYCVHKSLNDKT
jgi:hypothetical protein